LEKRLDARCIMRSMSVTNESLPLPIWTQSAGEEVANGISHGIGLVGAMIGTPILLLAALHHGNISSHFAAVFICAI
jgi:predicted membrane channel-forming protein YqfA (hemolysin III family)